MLAIAKKISGTKKHGFSAFGMLKNQTIRLFVPALAVLGWLGSSLPSMAVLTTYNGNDYRVCAGRLKSVGVTPDAASVGCASALRPRELASCVARIHKTDIVASDALASCRQARRPEELARCVVDISENYKETVNPTTLKNCSRSLLPMRFAECVVALRLEFNSKLMQAMDNCIDASDRAVSGYLPSFIPATRSQDIQPVFESNPIPTNRPKN